MPDGKYFKLMRRFTYRIGKRFSRRMISVPASFLSDFASIPKFLLFLLPWWAKINKPSIIHDWLYKIKQIMGKPISRKEADDVWLEAMLIDFRRHKFGKLVAYLCYYTVRGFAWLAWRNKKYSKSLGLELRPTQK